VKAKLAVEWVSHGATFDAGQLWNCMTLVRLDDVTNEVTLCLEVSKNSYNKTAKQIDRR
jgi:hypothetical protein